MTTDLITAKPYVGNRRITNGYKRFVGVSDEYIVNGTWDETNTGFVDDYELLEASLAVSLNTTDGGNQTWVPAVVGRAIPATDDLPAREALRALITSTNLMPPAWTNRRRG